MNSELRQRINDELKSAMKSGDEKKKLVVRLITAHIKNEEVNARTDGRNGVISDADILGLIRREIKQHEESIADAEKSGRADIVAEQQSELELLRAYLPKQLSRDEISALAKQIIAENNVTSPKQLGVVMKMIQPKVKDIADGKMVNEVVRELLGA
jgi:uncharacterized protein YqeY